MTTEERQQSLINARLACDYLRTVVLRQLWPENAKQVECLIAEFKRLDEKELRQAEAGREFDHLGAEHGKKGGRPKGSTKNGGKK